MRKRMDAPASHRRTATDSSGGYARPGGQADLYLLSQK